MSLRTEDSSTTILFDSPGVRLAGTRLRFNSVRDVEKTRETVRSSVLVMVISRRLTES